MPDDVQAVSPAERVGRGAVRAGSAGDEGGPDFLGSEVRDLRKARSLTLAQLSTVTDLSVGYLSEVERGRATPSVAALHRIARGLGVSIGWFFRNDDPERLEERDVVVRAGRRRKLSFESGITDELLSPNLRGSIELLLSRFPPGSTSGAEPYSHRGEEAGVVIRGAIELWVGERRFLLHEGDSFAFASATPHRYRNPGQEEAVVIWSITPPTY
ncbi:MAG TPA: XRE family transcriptional regulator [Mesorhizobium sp.]|jgi:transcriptional regulator with XRE-family HTH domain|nr:XRE family transcriptional regulator [Mesorhizobium sp.]